MMKDGNKGGGKTGKMVRMGLRKVPGLQDVDVKKGNVNWVCDWGDAVLWD